MRRDDASDPEHSQLMLPALFGGVDFVAEYNPVSGMAFWDVVELPGIDNPYSDDILFIVSRETKFSHKRIWNLPIFIVVIGGDMGYSWPVNFEPDVLPDTSNQVSFTTEGPNATSAELEINATGVDIATIKYGFFYAGTSTLKVGDTWLSLDEIVDKDMEGFGITTVQISESRVINASLPLDKSGGLGGMCLYI